MAGSTLKEGASLLDGWLHIEGRGRFTGGLGLHRRKEQVYWMTGSTLKEGDYLLNGWLHVEGRGGITGWLAPH